jgi:sugar (pentulose or hexulose) kinase
MKCLGIDIGSTSIKGAVLDLQQRAVGKLVTCPFPAPLDGLPTGWMEIDPRPVCDAVDFILTTLIDEAPEADRLYCSGQMGGLILIDDDVRALSNYISWARSADALLDILRPILPGCRPHLLGIGGCFSASRQRTPTRLGDAPLGVASSA